MSQLNSDLIKITDIPSAGRGVIATGLISKDTILLRSEGPAAHVIFRDYRKEVCAQCFLYDRGRTLPIRQNDTGKVFCSLTCEKEWLVEEGEIGLSAWRALHAFVQARNKTMSSRDVLLLEDRPDERTLEAAWTKAEEMSRPVSESKEGTKKRMQPPRLVDIDVLGYLLSGILYFQKHPDRWRTAVLDLAMDSTPYRDSIDLEVHCNSFVQLASMLPSEILSSCTSEICQILVGATSHNSFGIRAGSEDGEEYMGYALYPDASYFNHSCSPNVAKKRIAAKWEFRSSRDIEEGEQCCITYLGGDEDDLTVSTRRARLKVHWGFECMCDRCLKEGEA